MFSVNSEFTPTSQACVILTLLDIYRLQTKLSEGNDFTGVSQSFCPLGGGGGVCLRREGICLWIEERVSTFGGRRGGLPLEGREVYMQG